MYVNARVRHDAETTKFCPVAPNSRESSVWDWHSCHPFGA